MPTFKQAAFQISHSPYIFDTDSNGLPIFTKKNTDFLHAIIMNDSAYQQSFDPEAAYSSANFLNGRFPHNYDEMLRTVTLIDRENSTHLSVSSMVRGNNSNRGREIMADGLLKISDLESRIREGDRTLVQEISVLVPSRINFSFASKFCTYTNRYCFRGDAYSIWDAIVCDVLPYYAYVYLGKEFWTESYKGNKNSTIKRTFSDGKGNIRYHEYVELIDEIRSVINCVSDVTVTRRIFDWLLWYCYKGKSPRMSLAFSCLGNEQAKLFV